MRKIIIFVNTLTVLPFLITAKVAWHTEQEPQQKRTANHIAGGGNDSHAFPYAANYGFACGATILSQFWVLTAAQCGVQHQYLYVGSRYLSQCKNVTIAQHIIHPKFPNPDNEFDFDYQLLKLHKPLRFSEEIKSIKLGSEGDMTLGSIATVVGWGAPQVNGVGSDVYQEVNVPLLDNEVCKTKGGGIYGQYITDNMICAGHEKGGEDACEGDSGGPLVNNGVLIGIVSFGRGCGMKDIPGVYAKITPELIEWINQETGLDQKCY